MLKNLNLYQLIELELARSGKSRKELMAETGLSSLVFHTIKHKSARPTMQTLHKLSVGLNVPIELLYETTLRDYDGYTTDEDNELTNK